MSQLYTQKFESCIIEYCSEQGIRAYKLFEDGEIENGMDFLSHQLDVLEILAKSKTITEFAKSLKKLKIIDKDSVYTHLQENGFGQFIPE